MKDFNEGQHVYVDIVENGYWKDKIKGVFVCYTKHRAKILVNGKIKFYSKPRIYSR